MGSGKSEGVRIEGGLAYWRVFFWVWVLGLVVRGEGGIRVLPGWFSGDFEFGDFDGCDGVGSGCFADGADESAGDVGGGPGF